MQLFARIGYNILNRDKDEGHVRMLNPQGQLELVACKQQERPWIFCRFTSSSRI